MLGLALELLQDGKVETEPEELLLTFKKYVQKKQFFYKFVEKMIVVDPLDREIFGQDVENQAVAVEDLVKKVKEELVPVQGSKLSVPLSQYQYIKLKSLFDHGFQVIARHGEVFLEKAKESKVCTQ